MSFWNLWVVKAILSYALLIGLLCIPIFGLLFLFGVSLVMHTIEPHMWSMLPNLIIFALIVDILSKRLPRTFWIVPIIVYGSYYTLYISEAVKINAEEQKYQNTNPKLVIKYDPNKHALITEDQGNLVKFYKIPVTYDEHPHFAKTAFSYRVASPSLCDVARNLKIKNMSTFDLGWGKFKDGRFSDFNSQPHHFHQNPCRISSAEPPPESKSIVKVVRTNEGNGAMENDDKFVHKTTYDFYVDGVKSGTFITAKSLQLSIFPAGFAGCSVTSFSPSLHCYANLYKEPKELNTYPDGMDFDPDIANPIAVMLGLKKYERPDIRNFSDYPETTQYLNGLLEAKQSETPVGNVH